MAVTAAYTGYVSASGSGTTLTVANVPIGSGDANRKVVAAVWASGLESLDSLAFTIAGVAASIDRIAASDQVFIISADVPSGSTADIQLLASPSVGFAAIRVYAFRLIGPVVLHDAIAASVNASSLTAAINETPGGATIAAALSGNVGTWTYPPQAADEIAQFSVGLAEASGAGSTVQVARGGSGTIYLAAVHYRAVTPTANVEMALDGAGANLTASPGGVSGTIVALLDDAGAALTNLEFEGDIAFTLDGAEAEITNIAPAGDMVMGMDGATAGILAEVTVPEDQFMRVLMSRNTSEVIVFLLTISHPSLPEPKRYALSRPGHDIISNGALFKAVYFEPIWINDTERPVSVGLRVPNVNREVGSMLDDLEDPATVRMDLVLASNPNRLEVSAKNLRLKRATWDAVVVEGELGYRDYSNVPWPALAATPAFARALHK